MKTIKLKPSVILKDLTHDSCYALDCSADDEYFFKFEGPAKYFLEKIFEGTTTDQIIKTVHEIYPGTNEKQIKTDFESFLVDLKKFNLID